jgi:GT2 family glycosyltransferase
MAEIAILMTCFNRIKKTRDCLEGLRDQKFELDIYLLDDGSTDGTAELLQREFPYVRVCQGDGNLFWNRGMEKVWAYAESIKKYKYYIWLNDDVIVDDCCISELLSCSEMNEGSAVIVGIIQSPSGEVLYGGTDLKGALLRPNGDMQHVFHMNGNVVLVPDKVFSKLGKLDPFFHHDLGDVDYGLRARNNNIAVLTTRRFVGVGEKNNICRVRKNNVNIIRRFKVLYSPLGSPPSKNFYFRRKHNGYINASIYYLFVHALNFLPDKLVAFFFGDRYV